MPFLPLFGGSSPNPVADTLSIIADANLSISNCKASLIFTSFICDGNFMAAGYVTAPVYPWTNSYFGSDYFGFQEYQQDYWSTPYQSSAPPIILLSSTLFIQADGDINISDGKISIATPGFVCDGNFTGQDGKISPIIIYVIADGNFGESAGNKSQLNNQFTLDTGINVSDGRVSGFNLSLLADGNYNESSGKISKLQSSFICDGDFSEIVGKKISSIAYCIADGNFEGTPGRKSGLPINIVGDGNFSSNGGRISTIVAGFIDDGNLNSITGNCLYGGITNFIADGDYSEACGVIGFQFLSGTPDFVCDGNFVTNAGRISQISFASIRYISLEDGSIITLEDGGQLLSEDTVPYLSAEGIYNLTGIAKTASNISYENSADYQVDDGKICYAQANISCDGDYNNDSRYLLGGSTTYINDGDFSSQAGVIGFQLFAITPTFVCDGDLNVSSIRKTTSQQSYLNDANLNLNIYKLCPGNIFVNAEANCYVSDGKICFGLTNISNDGDFSISSRYLLGSSSVYINDGDYSEACGVIGFQLLAGTPNFVCDGNLGIAGIRLSPMQLYIAGDGDLACLTIRNLSSLVNIVLDGSFGSANVRGRTSQSGINCSADINITTYRNSYLQLNMVGDASFEEMLVKTGIITLSSNAPFVCEADLSIGGGVIYPVTATIIGDGNVYIIGPPGLGLDYIMNFNLKTTSNAGFSLRGDNKALFKLTLKNIVSV